MVSLSGSRDGSGGDGSFSVTIRNTTQGTSISSSVTCPNYSGHSSRAVGTILSFNKGDSISVSASAYTPIWGASGTASYSITIE